jgi:hypothetical protein
MTIDWDKYVLGPTADVFGEPVAYTTAAGSVLTGIQGVYDAAYKDVDLSDPLGTTAIVPVLGVRLALFPTPPGQDDVLYVPSAGLRYVVREVRQDGHGWAKLMLGEMVSP